MRFVLTHRPIPATNPIMPLLRQRHVAAILAGHLHRYERHVRDGVLQFTVGTGGEGAGNAAYTLATPDAIVSFIAYGYLRIGIAGDASATSSSTRPAASATAWNRRSRVAPPLLAGRPTGTTGSGARRGEKGAES